MSSNKIVDLREVQRYVSKPLPNSGIRSRQSSKSTLSISLLQCRTIEVHTITRYDFITPILADLPRQVDVLSVIRAIEKDHPVNVEALFGTKFQFPEVPDQRFSKAFPNERQLFLAGIIHHFVTQLRVQLRVQRHLVKANVEAQSQDL